MKSDEFIKVAKLGKVVGLNGQFKLHNLSDFPEQFKKNTTFLTDKNETLTIQSFDATRSVVKFIEINDRDSAKKYVNAFLQTTISKTKEQIKLQKDEFFWFDMFECFIVEDNETLGVVVDIERIGNANYLHVKSDERFDRKTHEDLFLIPYIDRYIVSVDMKQKNIFTKDVKYFLEK